MTNEDFRDWAERWTNDVYKLCRARGLPHGTIHSDAVLSLRSLSRRLRKANRAMGAIPRPPRREES